MPYIDGSIIPPSPLYRACLFGDIHKVRSLIGDPRVDPNKFEATSDNALECACRNGHHEIVKLLINHDRINPFYEGTVPRLGYSFRWKCDPIRAACINNHLTTLEVLLASKHRFEIPPVSERMGEPEILERLEAYEKCSKSE